MTSTPQPDDDPSPARPRAAAAARLPGRGGPALRWLRRIGATLALLALVAWIAVPIAVRRIGEAQATQALGRALRIGGAHFNPLTLTLRLDDVALAGPQPGLPDAAHVDRLELAFEWRSLWARAPVLRAAVAQGPRLRVARTGPGRFDFDDILARLARRPAPPADAPPVHFAVYNIRVEDGRIEFDDRPVGRRHVVDALELGVPFVSDLPGDTEIKVQPRLSFALDGVRYDSLAQATPFRSAPAGTIELRTGDIGLAPWLAYWPASLGWRPTQGRLKVDATLAFDAQPHGGPHWTLSGALGADDLALVDAAGAPLVAWRRLELQVRELRPFQRRVALQRVALDGLDVALDRDAQGQLNLARAFGAEAGAGADAGASAASATAAASAPATRTARAAAVAAARRGSVPRGSAGAVAALPPPPPWNVIVDTLDLSGARVAWHDADVAPATTYALQDVTLHVAGLRWPMPPGPAARLAAIASAPESSVPTSASASASASASTSTSTSTSTSVPASSPSPRTAAVAAAARDDAVRVQLKARWLTGASAAAPARPTAPPALPANGAAPAPADSGELALDGRFGAQRSEADLRLDQVALAPLRPYLARWWTPATEGRVSARLQARWDGALADTAPALDVAELAVDDLRLREAGRAVPAAAWHRLAIAGLSVDPAQRRLVLAGVQLSQPEFWIERDAAGGLNVARWLAAPARAGTAAPAVSLAGAASAAGAAGASNAASAANAASAVNVASTASAPGTAWQARAGRVAIDGGRVHWRDAPAAGPVSLDLDTLNLALADVAWPARPQATAALKVGARVLPGDRNGATAGRIDFDGRIGLAPVAWQGQLRAERVPLHVADAYLADASPLQLLHADAGWRGSVQGALTDLGLRLHARGDALLTDLHSRARHGADPANAGGDDLLSWQSLSARGADVAIAPGHAPVVAVGEVRLVDAFARLVVTEQGHFNLTDLAPPAASASASASASAPASTIPATVSTTAAAAPAEPASAVAEERPDIRIASLQWTDARVEYTDRFVRPNYSADLTGLTGSLGAFGTRSSDLAPLAFKGRIAGTGLLDVQGRLNPLARPLALDVQANASDIELAPLSPYAGKYAGYAIERGKLSMEVHYQVQPDGRLEAGNRVVLNQLTFGDKVESPDATKLPVLFAVALLKDRNGVIDVNLPIGGSINDPQFSVGGLVVKLIVDLLEKALTAPFALLAGGGGNDLSQVLFASGTALPQDGSDRTLDKIAEALQDRPALQLTITGLADDDQEHADLQAANLEARLAGLRRTELLQAGQGEVPANPPLSAEDRTRLVKRLYADTKLPDKPRNVLGLAKDVPQAEMESRLKAGLPLPAEAARRLAIQRALVVRDALVARGLPNERMFVASPKIHGAGSAEPESWLPHAQLELSAR